MLRNKYAPSLLYWGPQTDGQIPRWWRKLKTCVTQKPFIPKNVFIQTTRYGEYWIRNIEKMQKTIIRDEP